MNTDNQPTPTNYAEASELLGDKNVRKIANNTYLERIAEESRGTKGKIAIRLHATNIIYFHEDDTTYLNSGGYRTKTTLERINRYLPTNLRITQAAGTWLLADHNVPGIKLTHFVDNMMIDSKTGEVL